MDPRNPRRSSTPPVDIPVRRSSGRVWVVFLALGVAAVIAYFVAPEAQQETCYLGVGAVSVAAIVAGIRLHRPARPGGWYLLAASNA